MSINQRKKLAHGYRLAQAGYSLLIIIVLLLSASITSMHLISLSSFEYDKPGSEVYAILNKAKKMLLAEAITPQTGRSIDAIRLGEFPCPDSNHDGILQVPDDFNGSRCKTYQGWMPWKTLNADRELNYFESDAIWYVLSRGYENTSSHRILNSSTQPDLRFNNQDMVALLIYPGEARSYQNRDPGEDNFKQWNEYLEYEYGSSEVINPEASFSNDLVTGITHEEWKRMLAPQVLERISEDLNTYYQEKKTYPEDETVMAAKLVIDDIWIIRNQWNNLIKYKIHSKKNMSIELNGIQAVLKDGETVAWNQI